MIGDSGATNAWLPAALTAFGGFATAALGYVGLRYSDAKKDERTYEREKTARDAARRDAILERRNNFQRETLLELQVAVQKTIRNVAQMQHLDSMALRSGVSWHKQTYPESLNNESLAVNTQTTLLRARVEDDSIRAILAKFKDECGAIIFAQTKEDGDSKLAKAGDTFAVLNELIGQRLRKLEEIKIVD